jgi:hypothetical protein
MRLDFEYAFERSTLVVDSSVKGRTWPWPVP